MTTIDGTPGSWRLRLPGVAQAPAEALAAAEGCTVPELVAQLILDAHAKIATDAAASSAGVVSGQGDTRPPAPTNVLVRALDHFLGCTEGGRVFCGQPAPWTLVDPSTWKDLPWVGSPRGRACCDNHVPEGWVRPDEVTAPTVAATYTDPDGDRLTLLALHGRPADWSLVLTTADGEVERDVFFQDDETLASWCRMGLGAIEDRQR